MDTTEEISAILEDHQITYLDSLYVPNEANRRTNQKIKNKVLSGQAVMPGEQEILTAQHAQEIQGELDQDGNQRFIKPSDIPTKTWKKVLDGLEWEIEIINSDSIDTQEALTTLSTTLKWIASLQGRPMTPEEKIVFNKILTEAGSVSPLELSQIPNQKKLPQPIGGSMGEQLIPQK
jgi:hypothetical protein